MDTTVVSSKKPRTMCMQKKDDDVGISTLATLLASLCRWSEHSADAIYDLILPLVESDEMASYVPYLGRLAMTLGAKVEIVTLHPKIFSRVRKNTLTSLSYPHLSEYYQKIHNDFMLSFLNNSIKDAQMCENMQDTKMIQSFAEFFKSGGTLTPAIPTISMIRKILQSGHLVGATMTTHFVTHEFMEVGFNFNFVVVYDIDERFDIHIFDPKCGYVTFTYDEFLYGLYASAYGRIDNACLIILRNDDAHMPSKTQHVE